MGDLLKLAVTLDFELLIYGWSDFGDIKIQWNIRKQIRNSKNNSSKYERIIDLTAVCIKRNGETVFSWVLFKCRPTLHPLEQSKKKTIKK